MGKRLAIALAVAFAVGLAVATTAEARPPSEFPLWLKLNGEWVRPGNGVDGGGLMLWTADAGLATVTVTGGQVYYLPGCDVAANLCLYDGTATMQSIDGGCNTTRADPNYGHPLAADEARYIVTQNGTTKLIAAPRSSATLNCPVFTLQ